MPYTGRDEEVLARYAGTAPEMPRAGSGVATAAYLADRRTTAASLRAINAAHGETFYDVPEAATLDLEAARRDVPHRPRRCIDVQTHLVDPGALGSARRRPRSKGSCAWPTPTGGRARSTRARSTRPRGPRLVFGTSETAIALLTSTPGTAATNVLTNPQIAAAREVVDRYAGTGRVLTHTIVHPNVGAASSTRWPSGARRSAPSGWKVYTLCGPPTAASPTGGWFLDDDEIGFPFLERVRALGPRVVAAHKGLGGPDPRRVGRRGVAARHRAGRRGVPRHHVRRVPLGLRARSRRRGRCRTTARSRRRGVDRLVQSVDGRGHRTRRQRVRRARQHVVPHAAAAARSRARARQAAASRSGPNASCGAPTRSGTARRSRSSTRSARSASPSRCRSGSATPRSPRRRRNGSWA